MITKTVEVTQTIQVSLDETKFDDKFMAEFRSYMYPFYSIDDHAKHLAQMEARGLIANVNDHIEGYGHIREMGISMNLLDQDENIVDV